MANISQERELNLITGYTQPANRDEALLVRDIALRTFRRTTLAFKEELARMESDPKIDIDKKVVFDGQMFLRSVHGLGPEFIYNGIANYPRENGFTLTYGEDSQFKEMAGLRDDPLIDFLGRKIKWLEMEEDSLYASLDLHYWQALKEHEIKLRIDLNTLIGRSKSYLEAHPNLPQEQWEARIRYEAKIISENRFRDPNDPDANYFEAENVLKGQFREFWPPAVDENLPETKGRRKFWLPFWPAKGKGCLTKSGCLMPVLLVPIAAAAIALAADKCGPTDTKTAVKIETTSLADSTPVSADRTIDWFGQDWDGLAGLNVKGLLEHQMAWYKTMGNKIDGAAPDDPFLIETVREMEEKDPGFTKYLLKDFIAEVIAKNPGVEVLNYDPQNPEAAAFKAGQIKVPALQPSMGNWDAFDRNIGGHLTVKGFIETELQKYRARFPQSS